MVAVIFGTMFTLPVSAASGDKAAITFDYCYDSTGNTIKFQQTTVMTVIQSELPARSSAKFLQTAKKHTALNPVTACFRVIL